MTAIRTSAGSPSRRRPDSSPRCGGSLLPGGGDRRARTAPATAGRAELASPACPAASQVGSADAASGAGTKPLYTSGQGLPRGSLQGRSAQPRRGGPRSSPGPTTSATSSSGPPSTSTRRRRRSPPSPIRCLRSRGRSAADADDPGRPRPAELHAQPDELRTVLRGRGRSPASRAPSRAPRLPSRSRTARTSTMGPS